VCCISCSYCPAHKQYKNGVDSPPAGQLTVDCEGRRVATAGAAKGADADEHRSGDEDLLTTDDVRHRSCGVRWQARDIHHTTLTRECASNQIISSNSLRNEIYLLIHVPATNWPIIAPTSAAAATPPSRARRLMPATFPSAAYSGYSLRRSRNTRLITNRSYYGDTRRWCNCGISEKICGSTYCVCQEA
jgi:hypothetical protein